MLASILTAGIALTAAPAGTFTTTKAAASEKFISNGESAYTIVYDDAIGNTEMQAVSEFIAIMYDATGYQMKTVTDEDAVWSEDAKYICIGTNDYSTAAGVSVDMTKVNSNGYRIVTKGNSAFILGGGSWGTIWGVYDFFSEQLGYHYYFSDEIAYDEEKCEESDLVTLDKYDSPDWEWRIAGDGEVFNSKATRTRFRLQENSDVFTTTKKINFCHTYFYSSDGSLGFVPLAECWDTHRNWYSVDGGSLCFTRDPEGLAKQVLKGVIECINTTSDNTVNIHFSQPDNSSWCYCDSCVEVMNQWGGADRCSATNILFMKNYLSPLVSDYVAQNCPEKNVIIYIFAYWATKLPPVFTDAQIDQLKLPSNVGVQYCTGFPDRQPVVETESALVDAWGKLTDNFAVYDYAENFNGGPGCYLTHFNDFNRLASNIKYFYEQGGTIHYNLQAHNNKTNSDWSRLHIYLQSALTWDVNADVNALTEDFMDNYYKDAAPYMKEWFYTYRAWSAVNETYANRGNESFPLSLCLSFANLAEKAYEAILPHKFSNPELYQKLYDRITLETITYRASMLMAHANTISATYEGRKAYADEVKIDCAYFGISMAAEYSWTIDAWLNWLGYL